MNIESRHRTWAVVLAAGDGTRLASLTTDENGDRVPKQFCSLDGGPSLLDEAIGRAHRLVPRERTAVVAAAQHRVHWQRALWSLPEGNVIVQPGNCGTAHGILLATLQILRRDPLARIVFLPADHYVRDEAALESGLRNAMTALARDPASMLLVGIEAEEPDSELGYIVPGAPQCDGTASVLRFVEKPPVAEARRLLRESALWNSFIFAAHASALIAMLREVMPGTVDQMQSALARDARIGGPPLALNDLYARLEAVDFSRAVMQRFAQELRVVTAPACGWSDLGTPRRVGEVLSRLDRAPPRRHAETPLAAPRAPINLAARAAAAALAV
jgi:mannose-1-phosphate guanylyltransferase